MCASGTRTVRLYACNGVGDDKCMYRYGTRTLFLRRRRCLCRYGTVGYDTVRYRSLVNVHNDSTRTVRVRKCDDRYEKRSTVRYENSTVQARRGPNYRTLRDGTEPVPYFSKCVKQYRTFEIIRTVRCSPCSAPRRWTKNDGVRVAAYSTRTLLATRQSCPKTYTSGAIVFRKHV